MLADLAADLTRAISDGEIRPCFRPMVNLRTGVLAGFELRPRWCHPVRGIVHATEFVPIAHQNGLIGAMSERVLSAAAAVAATWPDDISLWMNLSTAQLHDRGLAERLLIAAEGFAFERLVFEITESSFLGNDESATEITAELRAAGAKLALGAIGAGCANMRQLLALPFDQVKIDPAFVRSMASRRESRQIVTAIIGLAQSLGMSTVAAGVESDEAADMLVTLGCDLGEGWLFGRPISAEEATAKVAGDGQPMYRTRKLAWMPIEHHAPRLPLAPNQSAAQLRALYDSAPVGLAFVDTSLRYQAVNRHLAAMMGVSVVSTLGRKIGDLVPEIYDQLEPYLRRALQGETISGFEIRVPRRGANDGEPIRIASYQPVRDVADDVVGISIAVIDITDLERYRTEPCQPEPAIDTRPAVAGLTARQSEVIRLLAAGRSVKEIARDLDLGIGTVKVHLAQAYRALGARNRIEAIRRSGLGGNLIAMT